MSRHEPENAVTFEKFAISESFSDVPCFVVQHVPAGDTDFTEYGSAENAWLQYEMGESWIREHVEGSGPKLEAAKREFLSAMEEYTPAEVLNAAADNHSWPFELGFIDA